MSITGLGITGLSDAQKTTALIAERKKAHGNWFLQSKIAQELKAIIRKHGAHLPPHQIEALEMDAVKTSRILAGDNNYADHWNDKEGYSRLGKAGHENPAPEAHKSDYDEALRKIAGAPHGMSEIPNIFGRSNLCGND